MTDSANPTGQPNEALRQIYELIVNGQQPAAISQLTGYLAAHPDDAEGWWLMANAVPDIPQAREALQNVLRVQPAHQQAIDLMNQLDAAEAEQYFNTDLFSDLTSPADSSVTQAVTSTTPDWLNDFGTVPDSAASTAAEVPDWLKAMGTDAAPAAEPIGTSAPGPLDDLSSWFDTPTELNSTPNAQAAAPIGGSTAGALDDMSSWFDTPAELSNSSAESEAVPAADMPDWLKAGATIEESPNAADTVPLEPIEPIGSPATGALDDMSSWFDTPTESPAAAIPEPVTAGAPGDRSVDDLLNWLDNPADTTVSPANESAAVESTIAASPEPVDDLASWFAVPTDQALEPGSEPAVASVSGIDSEAAAVPTDAMPDWMKNLAIGEPTTESPVESIPEAVTEPITIPVEPAIAATAVTEAITQPIAQPKKTEVLEPSPYDAAIPEMAALNQTLANASLSNEWQTADDLYQKPAPIEQDTVPSFVQDGAAKEAAIRAATDNTSASMNTQSPPLIAREPETSRRPLLIGLLVLLIIVVLAVILIPRFIQAPPVQTTAVAIVPTQATAESGAVTEEATAEATIAPTLAVTTAPPTVSTVAALITTSAATANSPASVATAVGTPAISTAAATAASMAAVIAALPNQLSAAGIPTASVAVQNSSLGKALTVSFCQPYGPNLQKNAYSAMDVLAAQVASFAGQAQAIAVEVHGCGASAPIEYRAVVLVSDAVAYENKQIDAHQFRAGWKTN